MAISPRENLMTLPNVEIRDVARAPEWGRIQKGGECAARERCA